MRAQKVYRAVCDPRAGIERAARLQRIQFSLPLAVVASLGLHALLAERDRHFLSSAGRAPHGRLHAALENHIIHEDPVQRDLGVGGKGGEQKQAKSSRSEGAWGLQ